MRAIDLHNDESIGKDNWFLCKLAIKTSYYYLLWEKSQQTEIKGEMNTL